jgi:NTP pyrophosphatase (non-canonical NTP hydrolase)
MNKMDKLEYMFMCQRDLQKHLLGAELPSDRPDLISPYALGLISEIGEVLQADKRWKSGMSKTGGDEKYHNHEEVLGELTDCLLYFMNLVMACNISEDELFQSFIDVQNKVRERNGLEKVRCPK